MEKVCPILLQSLSQKQLEAGARDSYNLSNQPRAARCIRINCVAYDDKTNTCKYFNNKINC